METLAGPRDPSDQHTGRHGDDECGNLRDEAITDRQHRVGPGCFPSRHTHLNHADEQTTEKVDARHQNAGDRIASNELTGTIHRAMEVGLESDRLTALPSLRIVDQACVQVRIDRHLLTGHRIQGEACADLGDTSCTLRHDHEVDDDQNDEYDETDREIAARHKVAECLDDLAGCYRSRPSIAEDQACRTDIQ